MHFESELLNDGLIELLDGGAEYSEFELLQRLQLPPYELIAADALNTHLGLFQTHFTLFHTLYQLQRLWLEEAKGYLLISALKIQFKPGNTALPVDEAEFKIRDYYLDLSHLSQTSEQDVENLLDSFWEQFGNVKNWQTPDTEQVAEAFNWFGLSVGCQWRDVKTGYYRVLHQQHPDKGGDISVAQVATQHFDVLKRFFKSA